jgi:propionyl-CoA synthetase
VALAASMRHVYQCNPGETYFATSDIGWVVGHSYIVYGPLINGMATVVYEGTPIRPDAGIWWKIVQDYKVSVVFSAPTAIRVLKKQDPAYLKKYDLSSPRQADLRPLLADRNRLGAPHRPARHRAASDQVRQPLLPRLRLRRAPAARGTGEEVPADEKGVVAVVPPLPPGCMTTVWGQDERFVQTYFTSFPGKQVYTTFDWGIRDKDGYYFILGRTDDVINVAGHRLGTREIEEAISAHAAIAEVAVVGVADQLKGQMPMAFAVVKDPAQIATPEQRAALEKAVMGTVDGLLGPIARPKNVHFINQLPKTRSGKVLRRSIQAIAEGPRSGRPDDPGRPDRHPDGEGRCHRQVPARPSPPSTRSRRRPSSSTPRTASRSPPGAWRSGRRRASCAASWW